MNATIHGLKPGISAQFTELTRRSSIIWTIFSTDNSCCAGWLVIWNNLFSDREQARQGIDAAVGHLNTGSEAIRRWKSGPKTSVAYQPDSIVTARSKRVAKITGRTGIRGFVE